MNTPDTQKPVMSLEETIAYCRNLQSASGSHLGRIFTSALHHLEAGKKLAEAILDQNDFRKTNGYGGELPTWAHTMLVGLLVNQSQRNEATS
jgi:hypothetical protein